MIPEIERVENRPGDVATWRIMNAWGYGFEILFTGYGDEDEVTMRWVTGHPPEKHVDIVSMSAGEFVRHVFGAVKDSMIAELEAENARLLDEVAALESDNKRLEEFEKTASFSNKITITIEFGRFSAYVLSYGEEIRSSQITSMRDVIDFVNRAAGDSRRFACTVGFPLISGV